MKTETSKSIANKLTEKDLLRLSVENPKYLGQALGQDPNDNALRADEKKEMLKYISKAWSGLAKSIKK